MWTVWIGDLWILRCTLGVVICFGCKLRWLRRSQQNTEQQRYWVLKIYHDWATLFQVIWEDALQLQWSRRTRKTSHTGGHPLTTRGRCEPFYCAPWSVVLWEQVVGDPWSWHWSQWSYPSTTCAKTSKAAFGSSVAATRCCRVSNFQTRSPFRSLCWRVQGKAKSHEQGIVIVNGTCQLN